MRVIAILVILLVAGGTLLAQETGGTFLAQENGGTLLAQEKEQEGAVRVSFTETIQRVGEISDTYFKALQERQKTGVLKLSSPEVSELKSRLLSLIGALDKFSGEAPLKQAELNKESSAALTAALTCQNCNGKVPPEGRAQSLKGREELQKLIRARCEAILSLLPSDSDVGI